MKESALLRRLQKKRERLWHRESRIQDEIHALSSEIDVEYERLNPPGEMVLKLRKQFDDEMIERFNALPTLTDLFGPQTPNERYRKGFEHIQWRKS